MYPWPLVRTKLSNVLPLVVFPIFLLGSQQCNSFVTPHTTSTWLLLMRDMDGFGQVWMGLDSVRVNDGVGQRTCGW